MIKVIVSHDVDHLYGHEHWFRDLIYPKLFIRSILQCVKSEIGLKEAILRVLSCFKRERHHIREVIEFDQKHGVHSIFFFGMSQGLGMSYYPEEAKEVIEYVNNEGVDVGVHGVSFDNLEKIKNDKDRFVELTGIIPQGERMHYVRYNEKTFEYLNLAEYVFDTTEFDKENGGTIKAPYKVGNMWEFPLTLMDRYLPNNLADAKRFTLDRLAECNKRGMSYITILFHDYQFCDAYRIMRDWYVWLIEMMALSDEYEFISYNDAIKELEGE